MSCSSLDLFHFHSIFSNFVDRSNGKKFEKIKSKKKKQNPKEKFLLSLLAQTSHTLDILRDSFLGIRSIFFSLVEIFSEANAGWCVCVCVSVMEHHRQHNKMNLSNIVFFYVPTIAFRNERKRWDENKWMNSLNERVKRLPRVGEMLYKHWTYHFVFIFILSSILLLLLLLFIHCCNFSFRFLLLFVIRFRSLIDSE